MEANEEKTRFRFRQGTRQNVEEDGSQSDLGYPVYQYVGEPYYDTTNGHLWIGNGTSQIKIDPRGMVFFEDEVVSFNNEVVLY